MDSVEFRERLVHALNLDLIGPGAGHDLASERLPGWVRPSNWYLTGFLNRAGAPPKQSADSGGLSIHGEVRPIDTAGPVRLRLLAFTHYLNRAPTSSAAPASNAETTSRRNRLRSGEGMASGMGAARS